MFEARVYICGIFLGAFRRFEDGSDAAGSRNVTARLEFLWGVIVLFVAGRIWRIWRVVGRAG